MVFQLVKEVRDINRFREILTVLFEEGFDFLIAKTKLKHKIPLTKWIKSRVERKKKHTIEKRLRLTLERLGPTFIKLGQLLSVRPDLVPKSYIKELEKLQDKVPSFSFAIVKEELNNGLGKNIDEIFLSFDKTPLASASISQVHKAILKDGTLVAVKIQRPNVRSIMETDVEIMLYFSKLLEKYIPNIRKYSPIKIIHEFWKWTQRELDFEREALNAKKFARNFSRSNTVKIPKIYSDFTTDKILVMEYIDGIELHNIQEARRKKINIKPFIEKGFEAILTQVFIHGFFHADPHPGNLIITKDKKIAFIDFGIVGHFDEDLKNKSIDLFSGIIENDTEKVVDTLIELSDVEVKNKEDFKDDVEEILDSLESKDISKVKISYALEEILELALNYGLKVPIPFVLFGKTVITLEGLALQYDPEFNIIEKSKPFIAKLIRQRYNPTYMLNNFMKSMFKFRKFAEEFPERTSKALRRIEKGTIKVDIEDSDINKLSLEIDRTGNRIAYSMLIAALLIVAALTTNFGDSFIFNLPLMSFLSFLASFLLSLVLFFSILREKNIIN